MKKEVDTRACSSTETLKILNVFKYITENLINKIKLLL